METQKFYLDCERFNYKNYSGEQISLPVYKEKNNQREEFNLVFLKKDDLVPLSWLSEIRSSLVLNRGKQKIITFQVTYEESGMKNIDEDDRIVITPQEIKGEWQEASEWIQENYPTAESAKLVNWLDCSNRKLVGCLDLSDFPRLKEVNCSNNYLTELVIPEQAKNVNASSNNITSLNSLEVNWEVVNLILDNNPLSIVEIVATIKSLHQNSELDRQELEKSRAEIEKLKQSIIVIKNNHKENFKTLKEEYQEQIAVAQETIAELDKKLTEKEQELAKKKGKNKNSNSITLTNNSDWWPKAKMPAIIIGIILVGGIIYFFCRKYLF